MFHPNKFPITLSSFKYEFNDHIERIFIHFIHPETMSEHDFSNNDSFSFKSIQTYPQKIYHLTLHLFQHDIIEIRNVHAYQESKYSSITNIATKVNGIELTHPILIEYKFFFNSCANNTLLIANIKREKCNEQLSDVLKEFIGEKMFLKGCEYVKEYLLRINKNIIHTESVLILRPLSQIWKCITTFEFWKQIYKEDKYSYSRKIYDEDNQVFTIVNIISNKKTTYKLKKKILLKDRISLRLLKESEGKNSIKKFLSLSILSISPITCFMTLETEIFSSVNLDFLSWLSQYQQCFLKNFKQKVEKLPCES